MNSEKEPIRLKQKELPAWREKQWLAQDARCALTGYTISLGKAVVDHDHKTGEIRGVLHSGVNALLGKIENNYRRYGLTLPMVYSMCENIRGYLEASPGHPVYPTHKTDEEKRIARNKKAREKRSEAKRGEAKRSEAKGAKKSIQE